MNSDLRQAAFDLQPTLMSWRRRLHQHPELSGREERTSAFVAAELRALGLTPQERIGGMFGLTATIGASRGAAIALRADMDALPIHEENTHDFVSQNPGVMHACGHDAHTAMLLGAARLLVERRASLTRPVRLVFQPSEEAPPGGAKPMIDAGALDGVDRAFGLHIWSDMPTGTIGTRSGVLMSSTDELDIIIHGRGGHAAMPQQCVDPVLIGAHVVAALQSIVSRSIAMTDHAVVSITRFHAGSANNIIAGQAALGGTVRALAAPVRAVAHRRVREIAESTAAAFGGRAEVVIHGGYPAVVNDAGMVDAVRRAAATLGVAPDAFLEPAPQGGGEDFAYFGQHVPSAFAFLGARNESKNCKFPHHHPRFDIDEDALSLGAALLAQVALDAP